MPTVHRACKSFPWHSCEHGLQTPSISMDQNPHRRPTGERALTFSQHVISATAARQGNRNNTWSWQKVYQFQVRSTVLYWCSAATATTKHDCHKDAQVHSWRLLFQGQKPAWNPAPAKVSWSFGTDLTESACHLEHLLCHRLAWRIRSFKPLPSLQTSFSKKLEPGSGRTAAAACSWRSHTAILHSVHWQPKEINSVKHYSPITLVSKEFTWKMHKLQHHLVKPLALQVTKPSFSLYQCC